MRATTQAAQDAKLLRRAEKRRILDRLAQGPASLDELIEAAGCERPKKARTLISELVRSDIVHAKLRDAPGKRIEYEMWSTIVQRLREKPPTGRRCRPHTMVSATARRIG